MNVMLVGYIISDFVLYILTYRVKGRIKLYEN